MLLGLSNCAQQSGRVNWLIGLALRACGWSACLDSYL
jgi:hypothetical protein